MPEEKPASRWLVSTDWLRQHLNDPDVVVLDASYYLANAKRDAELEANPGLVKTMSVKPPIGTGRVRLIEIVGLDLQPCGGTHVRRTGEIGAVRVTTIEKKGKQNRRVRISFA